jgi:TIR domain
MTSGHAFISYVHEDGKRVDRIQKLLTGAGIPVWRDRDALWPGADWKQKIRQAITDDAVAFIVCFSNASTNKTKSVQNEELQLAIDQIRQRKPGEPWLIPVRLDDVPIPDFEIGPGKQLNSIHYVNLLGDDWDEGSGRLLKAVNTILTKAGLEISAAAPPTFDSSVSSLKAALRNPAGDIALEEILMQLANNANEALGDRDRFPTSPDNLLGTAAENALFVGDLVEDQFLALKEILPALVTTSAWAKQEHLGTLIGTIERVLSPRNEGAGHTALLDLGWFPGVVLSYACGLAALQKRNYPATHAVLLETKVRDRDHGRIPLAGRSNPWRSFGNSEAAIQLLACRCEPDTELTDKQVQEFVSGYKRRHTPASDLLHYRLREHLRELVPDDRDYDQLFDRWEVLLALVMTDLGLESKPGDPYIDQPSFGRFTWRNQYQQSGQWVETMLQEEASSRGTDWAPVKSGLFGGLSTRALAAFDDFNPKAQQARERRF